MEKTHTHNKISFFYQENRNMSFLMNYVPKGSFLDIAKPLIRNTILNPQNYARPAKYYETDKYFEQEQHDTLSCRYATYNITSFVTELMSHTATGRDRGCKKKGSSFYEECNFDTSIFLDISHGLRTKKIRLKNVPLDKNLYIFENINLKINHAGPHQTRDAPAVRIFYQVVVGSLVEDPCQFHLDNAAAASAASSASSSSLADETEVVNPHPPPTFVHHSIRIPLIYYPHNEMETIQHFPTELRQVYNFVRQHTP